MPIDDLRLRDLLEQSHDLHSDAMRVTHESLDELVELGHDDRRNGDAHVLSVTDVASRNATLLGGFPTTGLLAGAG
ncbi:MAG TPA: hypothetical protein VFZ17_01575, partial [Acidimicrobiia bacterium]|nr:hypothetical protein [Acidimicrobiia bacterium]